MSAQQPLKVTKELLGVSESDAYNGSLEFDLGNLAAFEPSGLDASKFDAEKTREGACMDLATSITQSLIAKVFALPSEKADVGRMALLPPPSTPLPRAKPLPQPRAPTKWEIFAQQKGIQKKKRSKLEYDEAAGEWRRRHGYKKANDENDIAIMDAADDDMGGEDPFTKAKKEKKERVAKNQKQQVENLKKSVKAGGKRALPAGLQLVSDLSGPSKERSTRRRHLKDEIKAVSKTAGTATASVGKFDKQARGDKADARTSGKRKQRSSLFDPSEGKKTNTLVDKIIRERSDDVHLDIDKAMGRFEADTRALRADSKKKRVSGGAAAKGGGGKKGGKGK